MYIEEQGNGKEKSQIVFDLESSSSLPSIIAVSANREKRKKKKKKKKTEPKRSSHNHCCVDKRKGGKQATHSPSCVHR
jgi:hypothetical protein